MDLEELLLQRWEDDGGALGPSLDCETTDSDPSQTAKHIKGATTGTPVVVLDERFTAGGSQATRGII